MRLVSKGENMYAFYFSFSWAIGVLRKPLHLTQRSLFIYLTTDSLIASNVCSICDCACVHSHGCGHMWMGRFDSKRLILVSSLVSLHFTYWSRIFLNTELVHSASLAIQLALDIPLCPSVLGIQLRHWGPWHLFGCYGCALKSLNLLAH